MRNSTLGALKAKLRAELRQSSNPAVAQSADHILVNAIKGAQEWVYSQHNWPHKRTWVDIKLEAGAHLYDWPANMDYDRVERVLTKYGERWQPVELMTDPEVYNAFDTDLGVRQDPVLQYRIVDDDQLEAWPMPASRGILRIVGILRPNELSADDSKCPYDDELITAIAAFRMSAGRPAEKQLEARAMAIFNRLTSNASTAKNFHIGGMPASAPQRRTLVVRVVS